MANTFALLIAVGAGCALFATGHDAWGIAAFAAGMLGWSAATIYLRKF